MTEKRYDVRAGYYHEYTGICRNKEDNLTTNEVCDKLNSLVDENEQLKKQLNDIQNYINDTINENEEAMEWGKRNGADIGSMGFYTLMLKMMRKDWFE